MLISDRYHINKFQKVFMKQIIAIFLFIFAFASCTPSCDCKACAETCKQEQVQTDSTAVETPGTVTETTEETK